MAYPGTYVRLDGHGEAVRYLKSLRDSTAAVGRTRIGVGSAKAYAFGIETGWRRSGRLARRAGGAFMLRGGVAEVRPRIAPMIVAGLALGRPQNIGLVFGNIGRLLQAAVRRRTPIGRRPNPSRLRDSFVVGAR